MSYPPRRTGAVASACYIGSALFLSVGMLALGDQPLGANEAIEQNCNPVCHTWGATGTWCPSGYSCAGTGCQWTGACNCYKYTDLGGNKQVGCFTMKPNS